MADDATAPRTGTAPDERDAGRLRLLALGGAVFAAVATLLATWQGPGVNADSVSYFSSGLHLAAGDGLTTFSGGVLTMFPPGLPAVVALGDLVGLAPGTTLRWVNAAAFAAIVWMAYLLLRRHVRSNTIVATSIVFVSVGVPLLGVARMALTECLFIVLSLGLLLVLERAVEARRPAGWVLAAAALVSAGFLLRYAGIALVPFGAFVLLVGRRSTGLVRATVVAGAFSIASMVVPALVMLRNHRVAGNLMGPRSPSPDGPIITAQRFVATLGRWLLPDPTPRALQAAAGVAALATAAGVLVWCAVGVERRRALRWSPSPLVLVAFVVVYSGYLVAAQLMTAFDPIGTRLMSPLFVPLVVLVAALVDHVGDVVPVAQRQLLGRVALVGGVLLVAVQGVAFAAEVVESGRDGIDYSARDWQDSELVRAAGEVPDEARLYSNLPAGMWAVLQREPLVRSPEKSSRRGSERIAMSQEFLEAVACSDSYLAWSDEAEGDYLFTPDELGEYVQLDVVDELDDGTLYRITPIDADAVAC